MTRNQESTRSGARRAEVMGEANDEFVALVRTISDDDWSRIVPGEGWSVGVVAHHIAWGHEVAAGWIGLIRDGATEVPGNPALHDAQNAAKAAEVRGITRDQVIAIAERNVATLAGVLRSLSYHDMDKRAKFGPGGGFEMTVDQLAGARGHLDRHLASIRGALRSTVAS